MPKELPMKTSRAGVPLKLQSVLDQLSKTPSPTKSERGTLAEWEERNESWIDEALSKQDETEPCLGK
jgi:hypothetical protein